MPQTVSTILQWIATMSKVINYRFLSLAHHITPALLLASYQKLNRFSAPGVDKVTYREYGEGLEERLHELHERLKAGKYRAPHIKRVWIPKPGSTEKRPIGITTLEDKIVQKAVTTLLEPIYESEFYDFSYGYRPGRNCHQALKHLRDVVTCEQLDWIIDADISNYFSSIRHELLREMVKERIADGQIHRLLGKWLKAGILDGHQLSKPVSGTTQGGVISPLLANLYLHHVIDKWFVEQVQPRLTGASALIRVADDFVIACEHRHDAEKLMRVLPQRLERYGLSLNQEKTRLIDFTSPCSTDPDSSPGNFDFLGFRHYWGRARSGKWVVKRKTAPKRLRRARKVINEWCRRNRHLPVKVQHTLLSQKLMGHYRYFGITCNSPRLQSVFQCVVCSWRKWLGRRGSKPISWEKFQDILTTYPLPTPRIVHKGTV